MIRRPLSVALLAACVTAALPAATSAQPAKSGRPAIKGLEVGYFGTGLIAHTIDVFVYSRSQPSTGTQVTVCYKGVCKRARGHNASVAWYQASFSSPPLPMGAPVTFSAVASNSLGKAKTRVTQGLLCMHNNGSTPQTS
jgi:hypothetical protein